MSKRYTKQHARICVVFGLLFCMVGCVNSISDYNSKYPFEQAAMRRLSIQVDKDHNQELFTQMRKFSKDYNFEFHISLYNDQETFNILMEGKEINILVLSFVNTTELNIDFFANDPSKPPTLETIDKLYNNLRDYLIGIPSVRILNG